MGAPEGNSNAVRGKKFRESLMARLMRGDKTKPSKRLDKVAEALILKAMEGDITAIREVADRLDGKPRQEVEHSGDPDAPLITRVELVPLNDKRTS